MKVSSKSRKSAEIGGQDSRVRYIQTDCVVHSGSSGGPLINLSGQVIGINTTRAESEGISFAIRIDTALDMIRQLLLDGKVIRPFLGIHMTSITRGLWKQLQESGDIVKVFQLSLILGSVFGSRNSYYKCKIILFNPRYFPQVLLKRLDWLFLMLSLM